MGEAEQVVDDFESLLPLRVVDAAYVHQQLELAVDVVAQELENLVDGFQPRADHQLAGLEADDGDVVGQGGRDVLTKVIKGHCSLETLCRVARGGSPPERPRPPDFFCN